MIFGHGSDVNFCVLVRSRLICVKIVNQTQQHNDTSIVIRSNLMFALARSRSIDAFCRFSRLQTRSNDVKTPLLFFHKFRFPGTKPQRV